MVVTAITSLSFLTLTNDLDEFFVGQEPDIINARCWLGAAIIHAEMLRQHVERADLGV